MKFTAKLEVSQTSSYIGFDLEDLNIESEDEWNFLSEDEQRQKVIEYVHDINDQPYWVLDTFANY